MVMLPSSKACPALDAPRIAAFGHGTRLKATAPFGDGTLVTVPSHNRPRPQRCDVVLRTDGALQIVLTGDWIAPSERWLIEQVFSDVAAHAGPVTLDTEGMLRVSDEVAALVRGFSAKWHDGVLRPARIGA